MKQEDSPNHEKVIKNSRMNKGFNTPKLKHPKMIKLVSSAKKGRFENASSFHSFHIKSGGLQK